MSDYNLTSDDLTHMFSSGTPLGNGQESLGLIDSSPTTGQPVSFGPDDLFSLFTQKSQPQVPTPGQNQGSSFTSTSQWGHSIDPSSDLPIGGPITQGYGATDYSSANPQIYHGSGHNGIDIRVPTGTPIPENSGGTVVQVGDMGKSAYGKYIVVKGSDGITRLYGHLSQQNVQPGQTISPGTVIGFTGATGAATGPHLHYSEFKS